MNEIPVSREEFDKLVKKVDENTEVTKAVYDILTTFRIMFLVAKWLAAIAAAGVGIAKVWKEFSAT